MEANVVAIIAAVWGALWTLNSAISAFLQTKWMWNQKKLLKEIRDLLKLMAPDDIRKSCTGDCTGELWKSDLSTLPPINTSRTKRKKKKH